MYPTSVPSSQISFTISKRVLQLEKRKRKKANRDRETKEKEGN
jgi:hypothetical protein